MTINILRFAGCTGGDSCCTQGNKCDLDEGDCDHDEECFEGLKCGANNCKHKNGLQWDNADDCCFKPGSYLFILSVQNELF